MFTQCPKCGSYFRVRDEELHAADGQVRCSLCTNTFNALSHLEAELPREDDKSPVDLAQTPDWHAAEEIQSEALPVEDTVQERDPLTADLFGTDAADRRPTPDKSEPPKPTAQSKPKPEPKPKPKPEARKEASAPVESANTAAHADNPFQTQDKATRPSSKPLITSPFATEEDTTASLSRESPLWVAASVFMLVLLGLQMIHAERHYWAHHSVLGGLVSGIYNTVGSGIPEQRDLNQLEVIRTDITGGEGRGQQLRLTGVVENQSDQNQPFPVVYVRLEDRWGLNMGHGFFEPAEWVYRDQLPAHFPARSRLPLRLELSDPGQDAVGFHIELCWSEGDQYACQPQRGGAAFTR